MSVLQIKVTHPTREVQNLDAPFGVYMIGSDDSNRIVLADGSVEEAHAVLTLMKDESYIEDLMDAGIFVAGERVRQRQRVFSGSPIQLGNYTLLFGADDELTAEPSDPVPALPVGRAIQTAPAGKICVAFPIATAPTPLIVFQFFLVFSGFSLGV